MCLSQGVVSPQSLADGKEAEEKAPIMAVPQDASQATTRGEAVNDFVRSPQVLRWRTLPAFSRHRSLAPGRAFSPLSGAEWRNALQHATT